MCKAAVKNPKAEWLLLRALCVNNLNNNSNANGNNNLNNNARLRLITQMENSELYIKLCSYQNLELAFKKARKHKTLKNMSLNLKTTLKKIWQISGMNLFFTHTDQNL